MTKAPRSWVGLTQVAGAGLIWGTIGVTAVFVRRHAPLDALVIAGWRAVIGAVFLVAWIVVAGRSAELGTAWRRDRLHLLVVGVLTALFQIGFFLGIVWAGVSIATVVSLGFAPVVLAVVGSFRRHHVVHPASIVVALAGLVLVSGLTPGLGPHPAAGVAVALAGGAAYAGATWFSEALSQRTQPLTLAAVTIPVSAVIVVAAALSSGGPWATSDPTALALLVYAGVATAAIAYALLYAGLRTVPSGAAVVGTLLEPVAAVVLAAWLLGERLGPWGIAGSVLILAAIGSLGRRP